MFEKISPLKKKFNFYATVAASFFLSAAFTVLFFLALGYVFSLVSENFLQNGLGLFFILLIFTAIFRSFAIILLEGMVSWLHGLKVLIFDFLFILFQPRLWKLAAISFYFPYHLARWEAERLDLKKTGLTSRDLTYGETPYYSVKKIIKEIRPGGAEDLFVDLGSGIGKIVFFTALYFNLESLGIEINPALFRAADEIREKLKIKKAVFVAGNVLGEDFSRGTIFYLHGTSWGEEVFKKLVAKFEETRPGALILSVSHPLQADFLKFVKKIKIDLNWGREPLYIYQRS